MDSLQWNSVLIEWVNCLQISQPITSIKDLRNGEFLTNLTKLLFKNEDTSLDTLPVIIKVLKKQYPRYKFKKEHNVFMEDLSENDIVPIISLLMHYSCCVNRQEKLTSPMCHRLSQAAQLRIRIYLEKVQNTVNETELEQIIKQSMCNENMESHVMSNWFSAGDSPVCNSSPLQDFLNTPSKIAQLHEKHRELHKLQSQLETERYEKSDLQDELQQQINKNKILDAQLKQKAAEVTRLRGEIVALENRTPPHFLDANSREVQRRLRGEIEDLENYVAKLETDNESLQIENDASKEKVRKLELQCISMQEKVTVFQNNHDRLLEKSQRQDEELQSLKIHCTQLSAMLEEFRSQKSANQSAIEEYDAVVERSIEICPAEDLACSVVEVQLRDVQKENLDLKKIVSELQIKSQLVNDELYKAEKKCSELETNFLQLQDENLNLLAKVSLLSSTQEKLTLLEEELSQSCLRNNDFELQNNQLKSSLEKTEVMLNETLFLNESLKTNLQELHLQNKDYQLKLSEKDEIHKNLQKEIDFLKNDHQRIVEKFNNTQFELESKVKLLNKLDQDVETHLRKLENLIFKNDDSIFDNKNKNDIFKLLYQQIEQDINDKKSLTHKIYVSENLIKKLEEDISILNHRNAVNLEEKQKLRDRLQIAEDSQVVLQSTISDYELKISDLQNKIEELNLNIKELEKLKDIIIDKDDENAILQKENGILSKELCENKECVRKLKDVVFTLKSHQTSLEVKLKETQLNLQNQLDDVQSKLVEKNNIEKDMKILIKSLEDSTETLSNEINNKNSKITDIINQKEVLQRKVNEANAEISHLRASEFKLQEILINNEKSTLETINELNSKNEEYCNKITNLEEKLQSMVESYKKIEKEMHILEKEKEEAVNNWKINSEQLNKNIVLLKLTIDKLKDDIKKHTKEYEALLSKQLLEVHSRYVKLFDEKKACDAERDKLKLELNALFKKIEQAEEKCKEKDSIISESNKKLLVLKLKVENKNSLIQKYEADIDALNKEINNLKDNIGQLKEKNTMNEFQVVEMKKEIAILKKVKEDLQSSYNELEETTGNILKRVSLKNDDLNILISKLNSNKNSMQTEIEGLQVALKENDKKIQSLSDEKQILSDRQDREIAKLNDTILALTKSIEIINERELNYVHEIRILKEELSDTIRKYTETLQIERDAKVENETHIINLTENLHSLVSKYNELECKHQDTLLILDELRTQQETLEKEKISLENEILTVKSNLEKTHTTYKNSLLEEIRLLNEEQDNLKKQLEATIAESNRSRLHESELNAEVCNLHSVLKKIEMEKYNVAEKLNSLEREYERLTSQYEFSKIEHEKYVKYSESTLEDLKKQNIKKINDINKEKLILEEHNKKINNDIEKLQKEISDLVEKYTNTINEKDVELKKFNNLVKEYETKIAMLKLDKEELEKRIISEKAKNEEESIRSKSYYENTITKLKCANDILETGKCNLEKECARLKNHVEKLENNIKNITQAFKAVKEEKDNELLALNKEKSFYQVEIEMKNESLSDVEYDLLLLKRALDHIKTQNDILNKEKNNLNIELEQQEVVIKKLQQDLNEKTDSLNKIELKTQDLLRNINFLEENKLTLKEDIKMKQNKISDLTEENKKLEEKLQNCVTQISDLNSAIAQHLETISKLTSEKNKLENEINVLNTDLQVLKTSRDEIRDAQTKMIKETENNILRSHENVVDIKNELLKRLETAENVHREQTELKNDIKRLLEEEKNNSEILEVRLLELTNEKSRLTQISTLLQNSIIKLSRILQVKPVEYSFTDLDLNSCSDIEKIIVDIETKLLDIIEKKRTLSNTVSRLEQENLESLIKMEHLQNEKNCLDKEKDKLMKDYTVLTEERSVLRKLKDEQDKSFVELQMKNDILSAQCEQISEMQLDESKKSKNEMIALQEKNEKIYTEYNKLKGFLQEFKPKVNEMISLRTSLNGLYNNIKENLRDVHQKVKFDCNKDLLERKESLEIIFDDIHRQINRLSKFLYDLLQNILQIYVDSVECIISGKINNYEKYFEELNISEETDKMHDLKDAATDLLEKLKVLSCDIDSFYKKKPVLPLRENLALNKLNIKDEELKKKNVLLKQKLTLAESAKSSLERKVKQLREENKKLSSLDNDENYKTLLRQHIDTKNELERMLQKSDERYQRLVQEFEDYKLRECPDNKRDVKLESELQKLKEAYSNLMTDSNKFELENDSLRKKVQDCHAEISQLYLVKEAYEKLLEENNKLAMELDTIKYKRSRDREEFVRLLKMERDGGERNSSQRIQEIKNDYELKLEKMKEKMVKLYKEEVDKEMKKVSSEKNENVYLLRVVDQLKSNLKEAKLKIHETELERDKLLDKLKSLQKLDNTFDSKEPLMSMCSQMGFFVERESLRASVNSFSLPTGVRPSYSFSRNVEERKTSTLPRSNDNVIEKNNFSRRTSINSTAASIKPNIEMEDEEDTFNTKYLADLKEGRCNLPEEPDQSVRCSELVWRNSMCPPHLKSSYPAEMQFISPNRFKEDDIKFGNMEFDNSSTKLLPAEKPRSKKDIGTTTYKKPGPPTPSKNGGRVSLQGNEFHLKDAKDEGKTPKRFTPNRLKGLFMSRSSTVKDNSESHPSTPRSKRLSIFRKPR